MKVLVIGAAGQLGSDLCTEFADADLVRAGRSGPDVVLDITREEEVRTRVVEEIRPDLVVNTAAAHDVPRCEEEPEEAFAVNAIGARRLARACRECGARLVHVSTDYVFGDGGTRPWVETDRPAPLNVYGASKLAGEHLIAAECEDHVIVRSSGLYGNAPCRAKGGRNFVQLMLQLAATRPEVKVVTDESLAPTYTAPLARQIRLVAERGEPGLYHAVSNGGCSWHEFARAIFEETDSDVNLLEATEEDFPSPVRRPAYSILENRHLQEQGLDIMPDWRDALRAYLAEIGTQAT